MEYSDSLKIETPEQIDLDLELAGLGTRFIARLHDWLYKILLTSVVGLSAFLISLGAGPAVFEQGVVRYVLLGFYIACMFLIWFGYDIYFEVRANGRTPGKRAAGARVIRDGGGPVDLTSSCIRNLLAIADFLPLWYFLGSLMIIMTTKKQRLGDLAAGTIVIRDRVQAAPGDATNSMERFASNEITFTSSQLARCQANDRMILHSYFQRYDKMDEKARTALAMRLATNFQRKMQFPTTTPEPPTDAFLASLLRDLNRHMRQGY